MLPSSGKPVAGSSGSPQLPSGEGSRPFSGHGGAGGVIPVLVVPAGPSSDSASACCCARKLDSVGIRIGLAVAIPALTHSAASAAASAANHRSLIINASQRVDSH